MIKYLGSKRKLVGAIVDAVASLGGARSVLDLFSGTARVGHALKQAGYRVIANDHNLYANTLARCYVEADLERHRDDAEQLLEELRRLPGRPGWFTETFCEEARFFHPKNGARIDAIRDRIAALSLEPVLEAVLLAALMEAADRVDSTCGVQMAYLKRWAPRALKDLELRCPALLPQAPAGPGQALLTDARAAAAAADFDVAYLDPPYNQHSYLSNYHVWESLVRWDRPEVYGRARKRVDCRTRKSLFNSRPRFLEAFTEVLDALKARLIVVSFNDEGYVPRTEMETLLAGYGEVTVQAHGFKRYVGAQIGIHNPRGERVGEVSHLHNTEFLYLVRR